MPPPHKGCTARAWCCERLARQASVRAVRCASTGAMGNRMPLSRSHFSYEFGACQRKNRTRNNVSMGALRATARLSRLPC